MKLITPEEYIYVDSWEDVQSYAYCPTDCVIEFLKTENPRKLITAYSDYGLTEQELEHPNQDLLKHAEVHKWNEYSIERSYYVYANIGPCANPKTCNPHHKYSLKTERYTWYTFDELPKDLIKWYTTNLNTKIDRVHWLPFGINSKHEKGSKMLPEFRYRNKNGLLYANFQNNTRERFHLKRQLKQHCPYYITFREEANLPIEQYLDELASHRFCLCPFGNGYDTYRLWECIYVGTIPILKDSIFSRNILDAGIPCLLVDNLFRVLEEIPDVYVEDFDCSAAKLSYWMEKLRND